MSNEQSIRDEIARSRENVELANEIAGIVFFEIKRVWPDLHPLLDLRYGIADRVIALPLLNRVRAEAAAKALREFADAVRMPATLFYDGDGPITANDLLRQRAQAIEQNSEGSET